MTGKLCLFLILQAQEQVQRCYTHYSNHRAWKLSHPGYRHRSNGRKIVFAVHVLCSSQTPHCHWKLSLSALKAHLELQPSTPNHEVTELQETEVLGPPYCTSLIDTVLLNRLEINERGEQWWCHKCFQVLTRKRCELQGFELARLLLHLQGKWEELQEVTDSIALIYWREGKRNTVGKVPGNAWDTGLLRF